MSLARKSIVILMIAVNAFICFYVVFSALSEVEFLIGRRVESKGLYLLVVVIVGIPLMLVTSLLKWMLTKRTSLPIYYKYSWTLLVGAAIIVVCPLLSGDAAIVILPALVMGVLYVWEVKVIYRFRQRAGEFP